MALADKHKLQISINSFIPQRQSITGYAEYDVDVDAPNGMCFDGGDIQAITLNNSWYEDMNTAKAFWKYAYSELEERLRYYEKCSSEVEKERLRGEALHKQFKSF